MAAHRIVQAELARLGQHQDAEAGELLAAARQVKDRVRGNGHVGAQVGQAIAGRVHHRAGLDDGDGQPGLAVADLGGDMIVELRRALRIGADRVRHGP